MFINEKYTWAVIGPGPAGIATVGQLISHGVAPKTIIWIDPEFNVGDFAKHWSNESSNTTVKLFRDFLNHCDAFDYTDNSKEMG